MKIVVVSQRVDHYPDRNETWDSLDQRLIVFLAAAGFASVPVPNGLCSALSDGRDNHEALDWWLAAIRPQAFVLSGGNDIGEYRERDLTERWLLDHASERQIPLLGICRGMQIMADWAGMGLKPVQDHVRTRHRLSGDVTGEVNSYHTLSLVNCPDGFQVLSWSEDGEIEAIRSESLPWEGWMWHPEREKQFAARDIQRLRELFL